MLRFKTMEGRNKFLNNVILVADKYIFRREKWLCCYYDYVIANKNIARTISQCNVSTSRKTLLRVLFHLCILSKSCISRFMFFCLLVSLSLLLSFSLSLPLSIPPSISLFLSPSFFLSLPLSSSLSLPLSFPLSISLCGYDCRGTIMEMCLICMHGGHWVRPSPQDRSIGLL